MVMKKANNCCIIFNEVQISTLNGIKLPLYPGFGPMVIGNGLLFYFNRRGGFCYSKETDIICGMRLRVHEQEVAQPKCRTHLDMKMHYILKKKMIIAIFEDILSSKPTKKSGKQLYINKFFY